MKTVKLYETQGIQVNNVGQCTNFGGLDIDGQVMYTIKTARTNRVSAISIYYSYDNKKRESHKFRDCLLHGNDIAYYDGDVYVATCGQFCGVISTTFWDFRRLECEKYISAIAHYKKNKFLVLSDAGPTYNISIAMPVDNQLKILKTWTVNNPKWAEGYIISQGMGFNKNNQCAYVVFTNADYQSNIVLRSGLYSNDPDICYLSKRAIAGKYELEGIGFDEDGMMILGSNLPSGKDSIFISDATRYYGEYDIQMI